jgi:hypothetical protein
LAIVETQTQWGHYLKGANYKVLIGCDHKNLEYFHTSELLSRRQARWSETGSAYDLAVEYLEDSKNPAAGLSRRPNYEIAYESCVERLLATVLVEP